MTQNDIKLMTQNLTSMVKSVDVSKLKLITPSKHTTGIANAQVLKIAAIFAQT